MNNDNDPLLNRGSSLLLGNCLCDICFLRQSDADFDTFLEAGFFVVAAEGTDWVNDLVHLPEGLAVHGCVEVIEVLPDDLVIESVKLRVDIE